MKKLLYFAIPLVVIILASKFYRSESQSANGSISDAEDCILSAQTFKETNTEGTVIIDVRTQKEYDYGHVDNAIVIDIYQRDFKEKVARLDREQKYLVYCKSGIRSSKAAAYMRKNGFSKVCELEGGINYLSRAGVKLVN